jgi:hypothetical protein
MPHPLPEDVTVDAIAVTEEIPPPRALCASRSVPQRNPWRPSL